MHRTPEPMFIDCKEVRYSSNFAFNAKHRTTTETTKHTLPSVRKRRRRGGRGREGTVYSENIISVQVYIGFLKTLVNCYIKII